jgi:hypothetical protein
MTKACTCRAGYRRVPDSTSPGLPHDGFPYLGALRYAADVERVEHEAGRSGALVVTAHAVQVEQRSGIGRENGRGGRPGPRERQRDERHKCQKVSARHVHTSPATPIFDEMSHGITRVTGYRVSRRPLFCLTQRGEEILAEGKKATEPTKTPSSFLGSPRTPAAPEAARSLALGSGQIMYSLHDNSWILTRLGIRVSWRACAACRFRCS